MVMFEKLNLKVKWNINRLVGSWSWNW